MCLDHVDSTGKKIDLKLFGQNGLDAKTLDLNYIPCIPKQLTTKNKHLIDKECIVDYNSPKSLRDKLKATQDYIGRPAISIMTNVERLDL